MKIQVEFDVDLENISEDEAKEIFMEKFFEDTPSVIFDEDNEDWEILINNITLL